MWAPTYVSAYAGVKMGSKICSYSANCLIWEKENKINTEKNVAKWEEC